MGVEQEWIHHLGPQLAACLREALTKLREALGGLSTGSIQIAAEGPLFHEGDTVVAFGHQDVVAGQRARAGPQHLAGAGQLVEVGRLVVTHP